MNFQLQILGTASAMPFSDRNPSAQVLSVQGRLFLIDCGEGTQQQYRRMHLSFLRTEAIFISHIHGDHVFGIFGLLSTMSLYGRKEILPIYAPQSFGPVLKFYLSYFGGDFGFTVEHHPLKMKEPETVHVSRNVKVSAFPLRHKTECFGYRFDEILSERQAQTHNPRSYAYCSDTIPFDELANWVSGVDLLYHEATYPREYACKAGKYYHSTTTQAASCALKAGVGKLLVGHYSSRITDFDAYLKECTDIFPDTVAIQDGDVIEIPYLSKI